MGETLAQPHGNEKAPDRVRSPGPTGPKPGAKKQRETHDRTAPVRGEPIFFRAPASFSRITHRPLLTRYGMGGTYRRGGCHCLVGSFSLVCVFFYLF
jgi:hypothetical protein